MRFPKRSEYALRALVALSRRPQGHFLQIQEISSKENIPVKFLEQILLALRNAGILSSKRGVYGGYSLARDAGEIFVGEVIRVLDGAIETVDADDSARSRRCCVRLFLRDINTEINNMLNKHSIADIARIQPEEDILEFQI